MNIDLRNSQPEASGFHVRKRVQDRLGRDQERQGRNQERQGRKQLRPNRVHTEHDKELNAINHKKHREDIKHSQGFIIRRDASDLILAGLGINPLQCPIEVLDNDVGGNLNSRSEEASQKRPRPEIAVDNVSMSHLYDFKHRVSESPNQTTTRTCTSYADDNDDSLSINTRRIFGLYDDDMSLPLTKDERIAVDHIKNTAETQIIYEQCRINKLPLLATVLSELPPTTNMDETPDQLHRTATTELKMSYYTRNFEINNMTMSVSQCSSCGKIAQHPGVFMSCPIDPDQKINGNTNFIYRIVPPSAESGKFLNLTNNQYREEVNDGMNLVEVELCSLCRASIVSTKKEQPKFSEYSGNSVDRRPGAVSLSVFNLNGGAIVVLP